MGSRRFICLMLATVLAASISLAQAEMPPHLVLARPHAAAWSNPHSPAVTVKAEPYPYGYFGARGFTHWQRQFGINRTYTQWGRR